MTPRLEYAVALVVERNPRRVLEIGCGGGDAVVALLDALPDAQVVAIDRSETQVAKARVKTRAKCASSAIGRVRIEPIALEDALGSLGDAPFDTVVAVNVNAFWTNSAESFSAATRLLSREGTLILVYDAPSSSQRTRIRRDVLHAIAETGMTAREHDTESPTLVAVSATWNGA